MATKELAVVEHRESRLAHPLEFSSDQVRILAETVAKGCDQNELAYFLQVAKLKKLDPFTGQIHVVKRWDSGLGKEKMTVQTGIDGYRVIASRTNDLAGIDDAIYDSEEGEHPNWAKVTVYRYGRNDEKNPFTATARWGEYVQNVKDKGTGEFRPNRMWKTMPYLMLGKVAEALALRKAFPDELSGMYTNEEMEQADSEGAPPQQQRTGTTKPPVQPPQRASEKKSAEQASQPKEIEVSGIIESIRQGKGALWLTVKGEKLPVAVDEKNITEDKKPIQGYFVKLRCALRNNQNLGDYLVVQGMLEHSKVEDAVPIEEGKPDAESTPAAETPVAPQTESLQGLFNNGAVKKASEIPPPTGGQRKPGTIGTKKAQRLYALMGQNKAANNGFNEVEAKKILQHQYPQNTEHHLSDLEETMMEQFEKWSTGEEDWREYWKD